MKTLEQKFGLSGYVILTLENIETRETKKIKVPNLVVDVGFDTLAAFLSSSTAEVTGLTHLVVGTGVTTPTVNDVALETQTGSFEITSVNWVSPDLTFSLIIPVGDSVTFQELGLLGGNRYEYPSGQLFNRVVLDSSVTKTAVEQLTIDWTIVLSRTV